MRFNKENLLVHAVSEDTYSVIEESNKSRAISSTNKCFINKNVEMAQSFLVNSYSNFFDTNSNYAVDRYFKQSFQLIQSLQDRRDFSDCKCIELPKSLPLNNSLGQCISRRRSTREFTGDAVSLAHLATLMRASVGVTGRARIDVRDQDNPDYVAFHTAASGGGLYPVSLYVIAMNVKKLTQGVYYYDSIQDAMFQITPDSDPLEGFFGGSEKIKQKRPAFIVLYAAAPWRSMQKYGGKGLRFVLHEMGAISQSLNLSCVALGLSSLDYGSFSEDAINKALQFDGVYHTVLHTALVGIRG